MPSPNPVGWFEIPVKDMTRARHFYQSVFNVKFEMMEMGDELMAMFAYDHDAPGSSGALVSGSDYEPSAIGTMVYFDCTDIEPLLKKVEQVDGKVLLPKTSIGEHGYIGIFLDCEGNRVGMHSAQ